MHVVCSTLARGRSPTTCTIDNQDGGFEDCFISVDATPGDKTIKITGIFITMSVYRVRLSP